LARPSLCVPIAPFRSSPNGRLVDRALRPQLSLRIRAYL